MRIAKNTTAPPPHRIQAELRISAFTLAEVLITLGIIGIAAALTMPNLIAKYQNKVMAVQVKKIYSEYENAVRMYIAKNGCSDLSCLYKSGKTNEEINRDIAEQFANATVCLKKDNNNCVYEDIKTNVPQDNGHGFNSAQDAFNFPYIRTKSGASIRVRVSDDCPRIYETNVKDKDGNDIMVDGKPLTKLVRDYGCGNVYFDANGPFKGPNQMGADVHLIHILTDNKKLYETYSESLNKLLNKDEINYTPYEIGAEYKK